MIFSKETKRLKAEIEELTKENADRFEEFKRVDQQRIQLLGEIETLKKELIGYEALKKTARKQTKADILFNALQAVGIIGDDQKDRDYFARDRELISAHQQQRLLNCQSQGGLQNLFGSWPA